MILVPTCFFWPSNGVLHPLPQLFNILYKDRTSKFLLVVSPQFSTVKSHIWQEFDMYLIFSKKNKTKNKSSVPVFQFIVWGYVFENLVTNVPKTCYTYDFSKIL